MQSFLRQIVAGPRARHPEANLDLCYVTDNVIATSGPSASYPSLAYRNPLNELVSFLDKKHGAEWCIWEFRAEGTGYPDEEVYGRIWHFPWPDHHPPPFALVPKITASMRNWLHGEEGNGMILEGADGKKRVIVVHCKAGKGRSGTMAISYLMTHEGWRKEDALKRFTERRMRPGLGNGISIPSQLRWINYVERWSGIGGRMYVERPVEVTEVHVWGLRDGVTLAVQGYIESGKKIQTFHTFTHAERDDMDSEEAKRYKSIASVSGIVGELVAARRAKAKAKSDQTADGGKLSRTNTNNLLQPGNDGVDDTSPGSSTPGTPASESVGTSTVDATGQQGSTNTIFRPSKRVILPSSDINLDTERRAGWGNTIASVAHVWFNCYFEGNGPENYFKRREQAASEVGSMDCEVSLAPWAENSGVFEIEWDAMDGLKGSSRKGARSFDKIAVVWKAVPTDGTTASNGSSAQALPSEQPGQALSTTTTDQSQTPKDSSKLSTLVIPEPGPGEKVSPVEAANWRGSDPNVAEDGSPAEDKKDHAGHSLKAPSKPEDEGSDSEDGINGVRRGIIGEDGKEEEQNS